MPATAPSSSPDAQQSIRLRTPAWMALVALLFGIVLATGISTYLQRASQAEAQGIFDERAEGLKHQLEHRHTDLVHHLQALSAVLRTPDSLTPERFEQFLPPLDLLHENEGVTAVLFLAPQGKDPLLEHTPPRVVLASPQPLWQQRPLPNALELLATLRQARDTGVAKASLPLNLDTPEWPARALLLAQPVYNSAALPDSTAERRRLLRGWVVAIIDPATYMRALGQNVASGIDFDVYVGPAADALLVHDQDDESADDEANASTPKRFDPTRYQERQFRRVDLLPLSGQEVRLLLSANRHFNPGHALATGAIFILVTGLLLSVFAAWALWRIARERQRGQHKAQQLSEQLEVMAAVARATHNGVVITDRNNVIVWVNDGFTRLSGYSAEEAIGRYPDQLLASANLPAADQVRIDSAIREQRSLEIEIVNRRKDGQDYWLRLELRPYFNPQGVFQGYIEIETDIDAERKNNVLLRSTLNENDALMRALNQYAIVSETDPQGTITRVNERFEHYSGYQRDELLGKSYTILATDHQTPEFWDEVWSVVRSGQPWRSEVCDRRKDGQHFWLDSIVIPIVDSQGQLEKIVSISFDITQRKEAEHTLHDNREMFNRMGDIAGVGYWYDLIGTNRIEMSDQAIKIIEADPQHPPTAEEVYSRCSPESEFVLNMAIQEAADLAEPFDLELQFTTFQHRKKWLRLAAKPEFRDGKLWRLVGAIQDITDRVESQRRIVENDRILRSAIDAIGEAFVLYDPNDRLVFCNEIYRALYDRSSDLIVPGARFEDIIRIGVKRGQYPEAVGREEEWIAERLAIHYKDGISVEQQLSGNRWVRLAECRTQDGYHVGFRIDITDFKNAVRQAEEASSSKSRFLANMSHEIRTPMNAILGMLQLLQNTSLTANQADYVSKTQGAAKSLLGILNDILDFSKVEAGKMQLDPEPAVLDETMRELGVIMASNLGHKQLELLFDLDPALPRELVFDALRLKQVLINLAGNAIKFTAQGEVLVRVSVVKREEQQVWLEFSVKDSGIGISPENQQRIFEGFSQAEASTSRRFGGTGLGLAISQRLVQLMGGQLQLDSQLGLGSNFHFTVPFPLPQGSSPAPDALPIKQRTVLLLQGNPLARAIHARHLRAMGCFVDSADQPELALSQARSRQARGQQYDIVLLDAELPGHDSRLLVSRLRALWPAPAAALRVVAFGLQDTSRASSPFSAAEPWWDAWVLKPTTTSMLREALQPDLAPLSAPRIPTLPTGTQELAGLHILLVEDNLINQQVALELLQSRGALVQLALNGQQALDCLSLPDHGIDAVLMDMQMPVMDGLEATQAIRHRLQLHALPIIAMTANAMASDREQCLAVGMNDHIGKPFDLKQLVAVLLHWTGGHTRGPAPAPAGLAPLPSEALLPPPQKSTTPTAPQPSFDPDSAIERFGGDLAFYRKLLERFLTEAPDLHQQVQQHWGHSASDTAASSHSLKGSAATLGLVQLAGAAAKIEQHAKSLIQLGSSRNDWPAALLQDLETALRQSMGDSQQWLDRMAPPAQEATDQSSVDWSQQAEPLRRLGQLLQASDMESLEVFEHLASQPGMSQAPHWPALTEAMDTLDFDEAATVVAKMLESLPQ